ncbi:hypothetical protein SUGI_0251620 [Cryptomeria japonica]|nr:hypothetical protein SUGI_0251620 [Cryptomeria japonica]
MAERVGEFRHYQDEPIDNTYEGILSLAPSLVGLKIFVIRGGHCNQVIGEISKELVWLRWFEIGQRNLPSQLSLKNLRVLELYEPWEEKEHHLEELWEADNNAPVQLRELIISNCYKFQRFPNSIRCLKKLKRIVLEGDNNILALPEEFCYLRSLEHLQLFCPDLFSLPISFGALRNLQYLDMFGCQKLTGLPVSFRKLMLLQHLNLGFCHQLMLTSEDFQHITKLEFLRLSNCKQVEELPRHIADQASLTELYLDGIESLRELPVNIGQLSRLRKMEIGSKKLKNMPLSLRDLISLTSLTINACPKLNFAPLS